MVTSRNCALTFACCEPLTGEILLARRQLRLAAKFDAAGAGALASRCCLPDDIFTGFTRDVADQRGEHVT